VFKAAAPRLAALAPPKIGMRMELAKEPAEVQGASVAPYRYRRVLILLFQFLSVRHPLVIMTSIRWPLSARSGS
jgi:hypothetical protein